MASNAGFAGGGPDDAGGGDTSNDSPFPDGAFDAPGDQGADASTVTTALFVQASPSLPDVRLCWAPAGVVTGAFPFPSDGAMPGSNYPGVPLGGAASMTDATALLGDGVTLYAIDAENLARLEPAGATQSTCDELICPQGDTQVPCLRPNLDYWPVAPPTQGGLTSGAPNLVAFSGCLPSALDGNANARLCGPSWTALGGNLHADVLPLSGATPQGAAFSVQAAQLSPAVAALAGDGGAALVSFGGQDAADASTIAMLASEGALSSPIHLVLGSDLAVYGQLGFAVTVPDDEGGAGYEWMSLAESQQLVDPTQDPTLFFGHARTYVVAVLGDPDAPHAFAPGADAGYDGKGLHVLVVASPAPATGDP